MSANEDVIKAITELLDDPEYWDRVLEPPKRAEAPPPEPTPPPQPRLPKVGTLIQRSDHTNRRKQAILLQPPPPPPKRRQPTAGRRVNQQPADAAPAEQPPQLLMPAGPLPPPPIRVQIEPGLIVEVPHFAVHVSRRYKPRTPQGRFILRFSRTGQLRYHRRID